MERRKFVFDKLPEVLALFESSCTIAFNKFWSRHLMMHAASEYSIDKETLQLKGKEYINMVLMYSGPEIVTDLITLYGSEETFYHRLFADFIIKVKEREAVIKSGKDIISNNR